MCSFFFSCSPVVVSIRSTDACAPLAAGEGVFAISTIMVRGSLLRRGAASEESFSSHVLYQISCGFKKMESASSAGHDPGRGQWAGGSVLQVELAGVSGGGLDGLY